jgi:hypothetical protein
MHKCILEHKIIIISVLVITIVNLRTIIFIKYNIIVVDFISILLNKII